MHTVLVSKPVPLEVVMSHLVVSVSLLLCIQTPVKTTRDLSALCDFALSFVIAVELSWPWDIKVALLVFVAD